MLKIANSIRDLDFYGLTRVYSQYIREDGALNYPSLEPESQMISMEQDFYQYLIEFFKDSRSFYALWEDEGTYVSAMRLEPYRDGWLVSGLETLPEARGRGYAKELMMASMDYLKSLGGGKVYSHVGKKNAPSLSAHKSVGFRIISDSARYLDGSVSHQCYTLCFDEQRR